LEKKIISFQATATNVYTSTFSTFFFLCLEFFRRFFSIRQKVNSFSDLKIRLRFEQNITFVNMTKNETVDNKYVPRIISVT